MHTLRDFAQISTGSVVFTYDFVTHVSNRLRRLRRICDPPDLSIETENVTSFPKLFTT